MEELFRYFDKFYCIDDASKKLISEITSKRTLSKNEILQDIGFTCKTIYYIKSGIARIFYYNNGIDITDHFAFEGNIIVRVESLFTGKPSSKAIQILENAEIVAIDAVKLFHLYDNHHDIERLFRLIFEAEHVNSVRRIESLQFHTAKERYLELLDKKDIISRIPLKHIASYLGITQVSLSRIRATLV